MMEDLGTGIPSKCSSSNLYIKLILVYSQIYHFSPFTQLSTLHRLTLPASFQIVKTSHHALRALSYFHSYTSTVATRQQTANKTLCIRLVCEVASRLTQSQNHPRSKLIISVMSFDSKSIKDQLISLPPATRH